MKLVDTNVLVYAVNPDSLHHATARAWLEAALGGDEPVALAWLAMVGFVRIVAHRRILPKPLDLLLAMEYLDKCIHAPAAVVVHPGDRHAALFARMLVTVGEGGNLTNDAHLAAIAVEHEATLVSFDGDFERFAGLSFLRLRG
jgi:uncharacterized protein